ncbi:MAG: phage holin family protein [Armatimonadota bacterium]|nr:phage holin family protein [Armatimonadota bacterium]
MRRLLLRWLLMAGGLWAVIGVINLLFESPVKVTNPWAPFLAIIVLGLVNAFIRPLAKLLALPLNCLTFGIFGFVVNLVLFWLAFRMTPGWDIEWSLRTFLLLYLGMAVVSIIVNHIIRKDD